MQSFTKIEESLSKLAHEMLERRVEEETLLYPQSFTNMQDFLSLKKHDLRPLQQELKELGLSSLHHAHMHLHHTIEHEQAILRCMGSEPWNPPKLPTTSPSPRRAVEILRERSCFLKGDAPHSAVMLTLPSDSVRRPEFAAMLARSSVSIVRINTAHDTPEIWRSMAQMIRKINREARSTHPIRIYVDLAGPKIRTGYFRRVIVPFKTCTSRVQTLVLIPESQGGTRIEEDPQSPGSFRAFVAVEEAFYREMAHADYVEFDDHDRKPRHFKIAEYTPTHCRLECGKKVMITPQTRLTIQLEKKSFLSTRPLRFDTVPETIRLFAGDRVMLCRSDKEGRKFEEGEIRALIPCTMADAVFPKIREKDRIYIDDGKIGLSVLKKTDDGILAEVSSVKPGGAVVREEKGINFPDTPLDIPALTQEDIRHLQIVRPFADIIGLSFAQSGDDVRKLKELLNDTPQTGIVVKVETKEGIRALPEMLFELFSWENSGVMLARGDLAIEVGFENLARVQEEILDLCEAAHTPVIYATQILENLMKKSLPSRAEVIDASIAQRAECIMLNKGPFASSAVSVLEKILSSMQELFFKGEPLLSPLHVWDGFRDRLLHSDASSRPHEG